MTTDKELSKLFELSNRSEGEPFLCEFDIWKDGYRTAENRVCKWKSPDDEPNYTTSCGNELDYFLFNDTLKNLGTRCLFCGGKIEVVE
jgi:hypothetical protein